jgi:O-antigen ligase
MWLDIWLQLGILGVVALALTMISLMWRSWFVAIDRPRWDLIDTRPYTAHSLLPLLITTALVVQSFAESQLVIQSGWALVVILSLTVKVPARIHRAPTHAS